VISGSKRTFSKLQRTAKLQSSDDDDDDDDDDDGMVFVQEQSVYKAEAKISSVPNGQLLCTLQAVAPCAVACNSNCIVVGQFPFPFSFSFLQLASRFMFSFSLILCSQN